MKRHVSWRHFFLRRLFALIICGVSRCLWRVKIIGLENVPESGGFLLVSNHVTFLDPLWMLFLANPWHQVHSFVPASARYTSKKNLLSFFLAKLGSVPLQKKNDLSSIKAIIHKLNLGYFVGIFPEGTRTRDGHLSTFKTGPFLIAKKADVPILPVVMKGGYEFFSHAHHFPKIFKRDGWRFKRYQLIIEAGPLIESSYYKSKEALKNKVESDIKERLEKNNGALDNITKVINY